MKYPGTPEWEPKPARGPTILDWPDPEPLCEALAPLPYPVDALPALLRAHDDIERGLDTGGDYPSVRAGHRTVRGHLWLRRSPSLDHLGHEGGAAGGPASVR